MAPLLTVEAAFGVSPNVVPGALDWVDLSARVAGFSTQTGRDDVWSQPSAGSLDLDLDNSDGELDPDNSAGAWYGDLKPRTWVRVTGGPPGGAEVSVFVGKVSIEGWRVEHRPPDDSIVRITVLDALEDLANTRLPGSVWEASVRASAPTAWYRLGEASGAVANDASGNGHHGAYEGGATFNSRSGLVGYDSDSSIGFDGVDDAVNVPAAVTTAAVDPLTVSVWFQVDDGAVIGSDQYLWSAAPESKSRSEIVLNTDGTLHFSATNTSGASIYYVPTVSTVNDGQVHHAVGTWDGSTTATLYLDGALIGSAGSSPNQWDQVIGPGVAIGRHFGNFGFFAGTLDDVAVFDVEMSDADVSALYAAGTSPWEGDTTSERVARLLDLVAWPAGQRTVETTTDTTMPAASLDTDALTALQEAATAEGGILYVDHVDDGKLRFRTRSARWTDTRSRSSQATLGDDTGEVPYERMPTFESQRIINSVEVQRSGGSTFLVEDATSIAAYQPRSHSETGLLVEDDAEVISRGNWIVNTNKDERRAPKSVTLAPRADTHPAWDVVFALELGDRVTVKYQPHYGGTREYPCTVEGISHQWDQREQAWSTTLNLSPALDGGPGGGVFIIGESLIGGPDRIAY